jgi:hypothetical protein
MIRSRTLSDISEKEGLRIAQVNVAATAEAVSAADRDSYPKGEKVGATVLAGEASSFQRMRKRRGGMV